MDLTDDQIFEKHAKRCEHFTRNTLLPYEFEYTYIAFDYNVIKRKNGLSKVSRKNINFIINRLKNTKQKLLYLYRVS